MIGKRNACLGELRLVCFFLRLVYFFPKIKPILVFVRKVFSRLVNESLQERFIRKIQDGLIFALSHLGTLFFRFQTADGGGRDLSL